MFEIPTSDPPRTASTFGTDIYSRIAMASFVPDFNSGLGIASLFALAEEFDTTTTEINNLTSNWSIFLLGWGGVCSVPLMKRYGRLPVLWWSQVLGLGSSSELPPRPTLPPSPECGA
jgi:MFS family permease